MGLIIAFVLGYILIGSAALVIALVGLALLLVWKILEFVIKLLLKPFGLTIRNPRNRRYDQW